jgi:CRISPR system Cascade subunit CasB
MTGGKGLPLPSEENPAPAKASAWRSAELGVVGTIVDQRISKIQNGVLDNRSTSVAALARLRRAAGKRPGEIGDILEYTLADEFVTPRAGDEPTAEEIAAHIAMTLYAVHQQSKGQRMHQRGHGFGRAVRRLHPDDPTSPPSPVLRRFNTIGTADSLDELVHHMRGMVQLLRAAQIPLDYGLLADQLVRWQRPGGGAAVRLVWGREFYRTHKPVTDTPEPAAV